MKCPDCGIETIRREERENKNFKGKDVQLIYDVFECPECGEEYLDSKSLENAWKKIWDDYKVENEIPTPEELKEARENLNLTSEDLAIVIGRTKSLISKLENGKRNLSDKLLEYYKDYIIPGKDTFKKLFFENFRKGVFGNDDYKNISSKLSTNNNLLDLHMKTIYGMDGDDYNGNTIFTTEATVSIAEHIAQYNEQIYKTKLLKLYFYIDFYCYHYLGHSLTGIRYLKNFHGPTPLAFDFIIGILKDKGVIFDSDNPNIYNLNKPYTINNIFDEKEKDIIKRVLNTYSQFSSSKLSKLTHKEAGYIRTEDKKIIKYSKDSIKTLV